MTEADSNPDQAPATREGTPAEGHGDTGRDPWHYLRSHTDARIAMGRAGGSLRTRSLLEFNVAHARARDAVHTAFEIAPIEDALRGRGIGTERLATAARSRGEYLARPDLGRSLDTASAERVHALASALGPRDLAVLVSDGLSASAAMGHAAPTVAELAGILSAEGWSLYPVFLVPFARVKLQDQVGGILGARHSLILLGERPGLSSHDSLGAYLTYGPRADRTDADRNCVSNIRGGGVAPAEAARKLARILIESRRVGLSGTALRDV
jgi:ethanolamine ammonia-lyase small subunit